MLEIPESAKAPPLRAVSSIAIFPAVSDKDQYERLAQDNQRLFDRLHLAPEHWAGRRVAAPKAVAERLHASLLASFSRATQRNEPGGLFVTVGGVAASVVGREPRLCPTSSALRLCPFDSFPRPCAGREHTFWGFENYDRVQAALSRSEQRKVTTMLPLHETDDASWLPLLYGGLDGLQELVAFAKGACVGAAQLSPLSPSGAHFAYGSVRTTCRRRPRRRQYAVGMSHAPSEQPPGTLRLASGTCPSPASEEPQFRLEGW
jgi:hypothetical protein